MTAPVDTSVRLVSREAARAVIAARAASYAAHAGWGGLIGECLRAIGLADLVGPNAGPAAVLGDDWGRTEFDTLLTDGGAWDEAIDLVDRALNWAEAHPGDDGLEPLCDLVEKIMVKLGLGPYIWTRPSLR